MGSPEPFRLLSKEELSKLSKDELVTYLCNAIEAFSDDKTKVIRWSDGSEPADKPS